MTIFSANAI